MSYIFCVFPTSKTTKLTNQPINKPWSQCVRADCRETPKMCRTVCTPRPVLGSYAVNNIQQSLRWVPEAFRLGWARGREYMGQLWGGQSKEQTETIKPDNSNSEFFFHVKKLIQCTSTRPTSCKISVHVNTMLVHVGFTPLPLLEQVCKIPLFKNTTNTASKQILK